MNPPPHSRSSSQLRSSSPKPRRRVLRIFLALLFTGGIGSGATWFLTRTPRAFTCLTQENTICSEELETDFILLTNTPLWQQRQVFTKLKEDASKRSPEYRDAHLEITPLQEVVIRLEQAKPLLSLRVREEEYELLDNGRTKPSKNESSLRFEFSSLDEVAQLSSEEREQLAALYDKLRSFSPRIRRVQFVNSTEIRVYPENYGTVLFALNDIERQMSTLQAFFRSTTMSHTYQTLDVRFSNVAVIKE